MQLRLAASGLAIPEQVWARYVHPSRWPQWSPQIRRAELDDGTDRLTASSTGRVVGPLGLPVSFTVTDLNEADRHWSWQAGVGPIRVGLSHRVVAAATGTRTELELTGPAVVLIAYAPLAQFALQRLVRP